MSPPAPEITLASRSGKGQRGQNEDSLRLGHCRTGWYAVVADGAGGHLKGAEASQRSVQLIESLLQDAEDSAFHPETLSGIVRAAHAELQRLQVPGNPAASMHTTVVVLWVDRSMRRALWAHVGDSRLYRLRQGLVDLVTTDDSVVQQMISAGLISSAAARQHPHKNQLIAALGVQGEIDPHTVVRPVELRAGDAFLLCSDGWWDSLNALSIATTLETSRFADAWLAAMEQLIDARKAPRQDNYSAVAVWIGHPALAVGAPSEETVPMSRR